jgi:beta-glucosidase
LHRCNLRMKNSGLRSGAFFSYRMHYTKIRIFLSMRRKVPYMKYAKLISRMTLEEKVSLLSGHGNFTTKSVARLGIPGMFLSDGPHGLRKQAGATDHLGLNASLNATCYPTAATMANSWDPSLGEELGEHLGEECRAQRVNVLLGPGLNIKRSPLCGRAFEYFSEDPYLAGKLAAAYIRGIQSKGVAACPKHFAANSQETLRMSNDSVVDEQTLREIYLTGFEIAVKEGRPKAIMSAYNKINGVYANEDPKLLRDILVNEWGFEGIVVSDWGGSNDHVSGVASGSHLEMPAPGAYSDCEVSDAVRSGRLSEQVVDQRVNEYLSVLFSTVIPEDAPTAFNEQAHHTFARRAAGESIVLLKNEGNLLPLVSGKQVAVLGDFAQMPRYQGAGSSVVNPTRVDNSLTALRESGLSIAGYSQGFRRDGQSDAALLAEAAALAQAADIVLLYLGLSEVSESEGMDRKHMKLAGNQAELVEAVSAVNSNIVVVLSCGCAVELPWCDKVKAIVHGYLGGQAGAGALADVLIGNVNPSGKLAETYPIRYEDTPAFQHFPGTERTAEYREGPFIGYRYYDTAGIEVCFPFGHGLSYTTFAYSGLEVGENTVTFTLTNTGSVGGAEVAQVYVGKRDSALFRPTKELKGFTKIFLKPGERKRVSIPLDDKAFRSFNIKSGRFETEGGRYEIYVAASAADIRLTAALEVEGDLSSLPYDRDALPSYYTGRTNDVSDKEFEAMLSRTIPPAKWDRTKPLERNDSISQLFYAKNPLARLVGKILTGKKNRAEAAGKPDLNILFICNMPFRGIAKLMGPLVSMEMVDAILFIVNGHFFRGSGRLFCAWRRKHKQDKSMAEALANAGNE